MEMRSAKSIKNDKSHNTKLNNAIVYSNILPHIKGDTVIEEYFRSTIEMKEILDLKSGGKCKSCDLNRSTDLLISFVADFKKCPEDKRAVVISKILKDRQWISHSNKWINIVTNEIEDMDYEIIQIPMVANSKFVPPVERIQPAQPSQLPVVEKSIPAESEPMKVSVIDNPSGVDNDTAHGSTPITDVPVSQLLLESPTSSSKKYIFKNFQAPGDIVMMTAAIRDLHINHPGKYVTDIRTNSMPIWESNQYITKLDENDPNVVSVKLSYDLINQSNQGPYHFSEGFTEHLEEVLGVRIKRRIGRGHIQIGPSEEDWGRTERESWFREYGYGSETQFWIINAGHKNDFTCKMWPEERYQQLVDHYRGKILFVQIGHADHIHPKLDGVINLIGKTDDRQLIRLVWASSGVITPCSYPMTLAAAVPVRPGACNGRRNRPCVVIAGGREPSGWQAHTEHQFIHTCGMLPCCDQGGCWASRIKPIGDGDEKDTRNMCRHVVTSIEEVELPYCMDMITSEEVIRRIDMYQSFYQSGRKKTSSYNQR